MSRSENNFPSPGGSRDKRDKSQGTRDNSNHAGLRAPILVPGGLLVSETRPVNCPEIPLVSETSKKGGEPRDASIHAGFQAVSTLVPLVSRHVGGAKGKHSERSLWKDTLTRYVRDMRTVTYAELSRNVQGFNGLSDVKLTPSVVLWTGVSTKAGEALIELVTEGVIDMQPCSAYVYAMDGECLRLPLVTSKQHITRTSKRLRWLPVIFRIVGGSRGRH